MELFNLEIMKFFALKIMSFFVKPYYYILIVLMFLGFVSSNDLYNWEEKIIEKFGEE